MHDALRDRLLRRIESLPDEQIYQVLDFIEFLEAKYSDVPPVEASGLQRFAESFEDKLRKKAVSPTTIREAFQLISAADRVLGGVSSAGKQILADLGDALEVPEEGRGGTAAGGARGRRSRTSSGRPDASAGDGGGTTPGTPSRRSRETPPEGGSSGR